MANAVEGTMLWTPSNERAGRSNMAAYMRWLSNMRGQAFDAYDSLWRWSVEQPDAFWASIWEYFGIDAHAPYDTVLAGREMPGARWFPGARLNYAEHALAPTLRRAVRPRLGHGPYGGLRHRDERIAICEHE